VTEADTVTTVWVTPNKPHDRVIVGGAVRSIEDVAERHLCCGCGTCAYMQPTQIRMVDDLDQGRRPLVLRPPGGPAPDTSAALAACPGVGLAHQPAEQPPDLIPELLGAWGPVLEVWEGYATDAEVRRAASSGGAASALALHCIESQGMHGVLHIGARPDIPYLNRTMISRTRAELLAATGSRYAPASPGEGLGLVESAPAPCVFIGKPCDVGGADMARRRRPALDRKLGLTIAIFCAGTPSTRGTFAMLRAMGIDDVDRVASVRYRGNGWPGLADVRVEGDPIPRTLTYDESWGQILQKHRQWRCHVCADHTGELADVAVGDPWYQDIPPDEPGRSLVLVRSERGRQAVRRALASGALTMERVAPDILARSQPNLLVTRGAVWGRVATSKVLGIAAPRYRHMPTLSVWWRHLSVRQKVQSVYGTAKRVFSRKLHRRTPVVPFEPPG
jgi:coenzyme F420 hydrogenase subunit beta